MKKKISERSKIEYEPFDMTNALSIDGINTMQIDMVQLKAHNDGLQEQNGTLQEDLYAAKKAFELFIADYSVTVESKILSDKEVQEIITDYTNQAKEALKDK